MLPIKRVYQHTIVCKEMRQPSELKSVGVFCMQMKKLDARILSIVSKVVWRETRVFDCVTVRCTALCCIHDIYWLCMQRQFAFCQSLFPNPIALVYLLFH